MIKLAVGEAGQKTAAPFLNNNFICLCKPTATFSYIFFQACPALKNTACRAGSCQRLFISAKPPTSCGCTPWRIYNVNSSEMGIFQSVRQMDAYSKSECSEVEQILLSSSTGTLNHKFLLSFLHPCYSLRAEISPVQRILTFRKYFCFFFFFHPLPSFASIMFSTGPFNLLALWQITA